MCLAHSSSSSMTGAVCRAAGDRAHRILPRGRRPRPCSHRRSAGARSRYARIARARRPESRFDVTLGFYEIWNNKLYNQCDLRHAWPGGDPRICHVHRKVFLPTYRPVRRRAILSSAGEPFARSTLRGAARRCSCREDAWHSMTATIAALDGAAGSMFFVRRSASSSRFLAQRAVT